MTEQRRQLLEKYGFITAVATVITVAIMCAGMLVTISRWTGTQEIKTQSVCDEVKEAKSTINTLQRDIGCFPEKYYPRDEATRRWEQHLKKESEERTEILDSFKLLNTKLDKLYEIEMSSTRRR